MTPTLRSTLVPVGLTCALMAVVVAGVAWWNRHPAVNQAQARAVQPVIDAYMHDHAAQFGFGDVMNAGLTPELFCDATIIEIRPDGPRSRVGMMTFCGEYARRGNTLIEAAIGYDIAIAELMTSGLRAALSGAVPANGPHRRLRPGMGARELLSAGRPVDSEH